MTPEEYIKRYTRNCSNKLAYKEDDGKPMYHPWLTPENAEEVAIMAKDEALNNLLKDAQGDDLPEIDREVVAVQTITNVEGAFMVVIAHRPNPKGWNGKRVVNGKIKHYTPKTFGKGGWNIPNVKYWLDAPLPKGIDEH